MAFENIPTVVLEKIKEYALLQYGVSTVTELKAAIVDERFEQIVNDYLEEATLRILRAKADEAKFYEPTEDEVIAVLQAKIDTINLSEE